MSFLRLCLIKIKHMNEQKPFKVIKIADGYMVISGKQINQCKNHIPDTSKKVVDKNTLLNNKK